MKKNTNDINEWAGSNPVASVYLKRSGDEMNKMMLTDSGLVLVYKGKEYAFERESYKGLEVGFRKYLFPLIVGGILLPLSFLAMASNDFNPFYLVLFLLTGFYLLYAGWSGSPVLSVLHEPKDYDFPLFHISDNLKAFIAFANAYMLTAEKPEEQRRYIFIEVDPELWDHYNDTDYVFSGSRHKLEAMTWNQWQKYDKKKNGGNIIKVDLFKIKSKVSYEYDKASHELRPIVEWPVTRAAIYEYPDSRKGK